MNIYVVTPTYRRFDLCVQMLLSTEKGTRKPDKYVVLDNSGDGSAVQFMETAGLSDELKSKLEFIIAPENLGCGKGWNVLLKHVYEQDDKAIVIVVNDDIAFEPDAIELFERAIKSSLNGTIWCGDTDINAFSMWACQPYSVLHFLGKFDETLRVAYFEDNDMHYRMKLFNIDLIRVKGCKAKHNEGGSATIKAFSQEELAAHHHRFNRNQEYYIRKWGGLPHQEVYQTPFNGDDIMWHMMELYKKYGF